MTGGETIDLLACMRGGTDNALVALELIERFGLTQPRRRAPTPRATAKGSRSAHATLFWMSRAAA